MKQQLGLFMASLALLVATPASAATVLITYAGLVRDGQDGFGLFGAVAADLTGQAFEAVFTLNTELPGVRLTNESFKGPLPARITIGGYSHAVGQSGLYGRAYHGHEELYDDGFGITSFGHETFDQSEYTEGYTINGLSFDYIDFKTFPFGSLLGDWSSDSLNGISDGGFSYTVAIFNGPSTSSFATLNTQSVSVEEVSAVPEVATWAMMIVGFGAVGGAMRRRTKPAVRVSYA